jgi:bifunctional non-homologous end joining protein LigD
VEYRFGDVVIACTHVERVMFPDAGITKGDVIAYYHHVADAMLPELRRRPLTIERFTKGIDQGGFFMKHYQKHYPAWIDSIALAGKTAVRYPLCDTPAALVYFANQGGVALHVMASRADAIERPDVIVFDLDPPEGRFDLVRSAALVLRDLLPPLGLPTFVKTTGSKGLHVCVPVDGRATYDEVMQLCGAITRHVCRVHAAMFTTEFYKKDRKGRLFFDIERNRLGATFVAAYSLRGKPGAPISLPIAWDEVENPALAANAFTLRNVRERLDRVGNPWATLRAEQGSVAYALQRFAQLHATAENK